MIELFNLRSRYYTLSRPLVLTTLFHVCFPLPTLRTRYQQHKLVPDLVYDGLLRHTRAFCLSAVETFALYSPPYLLYVHANKTKSHKRPWTLAACPCAPSLQYLRPGVADGLTKRSHGFTSFRNLAGQFNIIARDHPREDYRPSQGGWGKGDNTLRNTKPRLLERIQVITILRSSAGEGIGRHVGRHLGIHRHQKETEKNRRKDQGYMTRDYR